jgi:hypothetical protein
LFADMLGHFIGILLVSMLAKLRIISTKVFDRFQRAAL